MAICAPKFDPNRCAAVLMADDDRATRLAGKPSIAPLHQGHQDREQLDTPLGQLVLVALALPVFAIGRATQQFVLHELVQPITEDVPCTSDDLMKLLETPQAKESLAQHEQGPFLSNDRQRRRHRAVLGRVPQSFIHIDILASTVARRNSGDYTALAFAT